MKDMLESDNMIKPLKQMGWLMLFISYLFLGCSTNDYMEPKEYQKWISSSSSGFKKVKKVNGVTITVQYLPPPLLAYREFITRKDDTPYDSVLSDYKCGMVFMVTLEAEKNDAEYGNLISYRLQSQAEYAARINFLNFRIHEFIYLSSGAETIQPVLSNFEGFDQIGNKLNFLVSFICPVSECSGKMNISGDIVLIFEDPFFSLGRNKFTFDSKTIIRHPKLVL